MRENKCSYYWTRNYFVAISSILLVTSLLSTASCTAANKPSSSTIAPLNAPFKMPQLKPPTFPDRTVDIRDYGAVGDGTTINTNAIASAIAACAKAGGGKVLVPKGIWLTGPIRLKSNINLHIADGAEVRFSTNFDDYLPVVFTRWEGTECYSYSPLIYANNCTNIAITGTGKLNGQGEAWWNWRMWQKTQLSDLRDTEYKGIPVKDRIFGTEKGALRPPLIQLINCRNVLIEGITATRSPFWVIHPVYCENVIIRKVSVFSHGMPNNDGIDLDSCKNVLIEHCFFATGDDAIAIKSGRDEDAWRVGRACENIVIRHCTSKGGHGGVVIGSEMSGGVRNVFIHDVYFDGTATGLRIKSKVGRGGVVENIWMQDITMIGISERPAFWVDALYASHKLMPRSKKLATFRNIHVKNLACWKSKRSIEISGYPAKLAENITLENVSVSAEKGLILNNARGVKLTKVNIVPASKSPLSPTMYLKDSQDVTIRNSRCFKGTDIFLKVQGKKTKNIQLINNDLSEAKKDVVLTENVPPDAVVRDAKKIVAPNAP